MRFYPVSLRFCLRDVPLAIGIGAAIGLVLWIGDTAQPLLPFVGLSAWIGLCIFLVVSLLLTAASGPLERWEGWRQKALLVVLFFAGGAGGFFVAVTVASAVLGLAIGGDAARPSTSAAAWGLRLGFAGGLGVVLGLLFFRYEMLKERLRRSLERISEQERAEEELQAARRIQERILGPSELEGRGYRIAARNLPAEVVAGDFFDVFPGGDGRLVLVMADVAGKGMAASLRMASVKGRLPLLVAGQPVSTALRRLNTALAAELEAREFVALCLARFDPQEGSLELANAGLPDPYLLPLDGRPRTLEVPGPRLPLGARGEVAYEESRHWLAPGDTLVLLTDGLPEAPAAGDEPLGYERLAEVVAGTAGAPGERLEALFARLGELAGGEREDDWTALLLQRTRI